MIEKWNYFVYDLSEAKKKDVDEDSFHTLIETQLQHLGWAKFKGEICHKPNIHIGNNNRIEPDILIKRDDEDEFVIEVKRPSHKQSKKDVDQLLSYMRLLKLSVGIYMGEHIEIFYDMPTSKEATSIMKVPLEIDNKLGARFIDKFMKDNFSRDAIVDFCEERIQEIQRQNSLNKIKESLVADAQAQIKESLKPYLLDKYGTTFSEEDITGMLSQLRFSATDIDSPQPYTEQEQQETDTDMESSESANKRVYDHTSYSLEGGPFLKKNKFVYAVVKTFVKQHPEATFDDIERTFPPTLQGPYGVVRTMDHIKEKNYNGRRYFNDQELVMQSSDGVSFAVSTQWGKGNIEKFLRTVRQLGYHVTLSSANDMNELTGHLSKQETTVNQQSGQLFHLYIRGCKAHAIFNESNHSMRILKGSLLPQSTVPSYRDGEKRNAIISTLSKLTKDGFWELQQDYVLASPSTAASYCSGRSSNGWNHWINDAGQTLDELYRN